MKKKYLGLIFKLKLGSGTKLCFSYNGGLEKLNNKIFSDALQPERFRPTLLAHAIAAHPDSYRYHSNNKPACRR